MCKTSLLIPLIFKIGATQTTAAHQWIKAVYTYVDDLVFQKPSNNLIKSPKMSWREDVEDVEQGNSKDKGRQGFNHFPFDHHGSMRSRDTWTLEPGHVTVMERLWMDRMSQPASRSTSGMQSMQKVHLCYPSMHVTSLAQCCQATHSTLMHSWWALEIQTAPNHSNHSSFLTDFIYFYIFSWTNYIATI